MKRPFFFFLFLTLFFTLALRLWRLGVPPVPIFDEVYYVPAARALMKRQGDPNWVHPPLAKALMAVSMRFLGDRPFAWRFPSVVASTVAALFFYLLAVDLLGGPQAGALACAFYLVDGIGFVQSRIAMLDMVMLGFLLPSIYFFRKQRWVLAGVFLGLAISCKWPACFAIPFYLALSVKKAKPGGGNFGRGGGLKPFFGICALSFLVYFVVVHFFTPYPRDMPMTWVAREKFRIREMRAETADTLRFHLRSSMTHPYKAPWWKWVLLIRPIWYFYDGNLYDGRPNEMAGVVCLPNPFSWVFGLLAMVWLCSRWRHEEAGFILLGFACFTFPWMFLGRGGFMYYLLPAAPFVSLALARAVWQNRIFSICAFCLSLFGFVLFFPLYSAIPMDQDIFYRLMWLKTWV